MFVNWWRLGYLILAILLFGIPAVLLVKRYRLLQSLNLSRTIAVIGGVVTLVTGIASAANELFATNVPVKVYVDNFWPKIPDFISYQSNSTAKVTGGGFQAANVMLRGLTIDTRLWLAMASLSITCVVVLVCILVFRIATDAHKGAAFRANLSNRLKVAGYAVTAVGMVGQVSQIVGTSFAQSQMFGTVASWGWQQGSVKNPFDTDVQYSQVFGMVHPSAAVFQLDFWPIFLGLALLVLARVYRQGQTLAKETEGLI